MIEKVFNGLVEMFHQTAQVNEKVSEVQKDFKRITLLVRLNNTRPELKVCDVSEAHAIKIIKGEIISCAVMAKPILKNGQIEAYFTKLFCPSEHVDTHRAIVIAGMGKMLSDIYSSSSIAVDKLQGFLDEVNA